MDCSVFSFLLCWAGKAEPRGFPSLLLHLMFLYSTSPQIYHLASFSSRKRRKKEGNYSWVLTGGPQGGGRGRGGVLWRKEGRKEGEWMLETGSEKCDSCKRCRGEKRGMSIIDCDDPSRMAVFPRGRRWADPSQSRRCGGRDRGGDGGGGGGVEHISLSLLHTHTHTHTQLTYHVIQHIPFPSCFGQNALNPSRPP